VEIGAPIRHHVHDDEPDALLKVCRALRHEGVAVSRTILVRRAHELDRAGEGRRCSFEDDEDLHHIRLIVATGAELHVRLGKIALRKLPVQVRGDIRRPGVMKRVPVAAKAYWRSEVVQQRGHRLLSPADPYPGVPPHDIVTNAGQ
jgi:hypothetical protein